MVVASRSTSKKDIRLENERLIMEAAEKVFAEAGFHLFLPADPTGYRLLGG